jgi:malonate decarboxylase epsilon subunit
MGVGWNSTAQKKVALGTRLAVEVAGSGALKRLAQPVFADDAVLDAGAAGVNAARIRIQRQRRIDNA